MFFLRHSVVLCVSRFLTVLSNSICCSTLCNWWVLLSGLKLFCVGYSNEHQSCQMRRRMLWVNWRTFNTCSVHIVQKSRRYALTLTLIDRSICFIGSGADISLLILLLLFYLFLLEWPCQKSARLRYFRSGPEWNLAGFWRSHVFNLMSDFEDAGHDVISCKKCCHLMSAQAASAQQSPVPDL